jgi:hypothetical protein
MKRGCVGVKDPPTTPAPTPLIIIPLYNSSTDVNYTMSVSVTGCLYWSEKKSKWTSEGCKVLAIIFVVHVYTFGTAN